MPYNDLQFKDACTAENMIAIISREPVQGNILQHWNLYDWIAPFLLRRKGFATPAGWGGQDGAGLEKSCHTYYVSADIVSWQKPWGGGMPIGAICASAKIAKTFDVSSGTTFGALGIRKFSFNLCTFLVRQ